MLRARPLYDNLADRELFVVPEGWDPLIRAIERELNVMVTGPRGIGKTTLLRQVQATLREQGTPVVFADATSATEPFELATRIRDALRGRPAPVQAGFQQLRSALPDPNPPPGGASRAFSSLFEQMGEVERTVVLVDASGSATATYGVFGRMRDVLWRLPHTWVVAVDEHERHVATKPPADAFFDTVLALKPFGTLDLTRLLELRTAGASPATLAKVAAGADGNPRVAIRALGEAIVNDRDPAEQLSGRGALLGRAAHLGRPHGMVMAELLDRGQASPSDEELQHSLGVSRARLTQLLRDLFKAGLVVADQDRATGQGRPRTSYRPALEDG